MKNHRIILSLFKYVFVISLAVVIVMSAAGRRTYIGPVLITMFTSLALYFMSHSKLKSFAFTVWVFAFVAVSMVYPVAFMTWNGFDLGVLITPLIQIIMFGMGTTLCLTDFGRVLKMPWPVFIGMALQFTVMPLVGYALAKGFGFEDEVAAGLVLIGSCPGGVASNLMTYLAGGNVALSVTMTSCSTLMSPVMTPFLMKSLAGKMIKVNFLSMMFSIINMIIFPIVAGLVANRILYSKHKEFRSSRILILIGMVCVSLAILLIRWDNNVLFVISGASLAKDGLIVGLMLIGIVAFAKLLVSVWLKGPENWMNNVLPIVSMVGICFIIAIITARSAEDLKHIVGWLILAAILHNTIGYILGYWGARAARLSETDCRTVAIEVGLQNGGMASGLAMNVLNNAKTALIPAIFGPWMNISGSVLASWWRRKPVKQTNKVHH
ncbi:MAG: bile acid:sodium symporter family protein [Sedimentisphaerales bacterium]|nr:bile acid:sodium symporter family protein [Sedimentisphaerales bacterium]